MIALSDHQWDYITIFGAIAACVVLAYILGVWP